MPHALRCGGYELFMNKTIIIITPGFAANEQDTSSVPYLQDYISELIHTVGAEKVKIIALQYPFTKKRYKWKGADVIPANGKNKKGLFRLLTFSKAVNAIKKILKNGECVLHSFWFTDAACIGNYISRKMQVPHISTIMGQDAKPENKMLTLLDLDKTITVALSHNQENVFLDTTGKRPNYLIQFGIEPVNKSLMQTERTIDVLFVGSFIPLKHPELFVDLIKSLKSDYPDVHAVMIGEGPMIKFIGEKIQDESLGQNITLTGNLPHEKVFEYMGKSKVLLHTSEYEGQCVVFNEALAYGMHVLSFNVGEIEHTEKHTACISYEDMSIQLYKLLSSELTFESYQPYTNHTTVEKYLKIYEL